MLQYINDHFQSLLLEIVVQSVGTTQVTLSCEMLGPSIMCIPLFGLISVFC